RQPGGAGHFEEPPAAGRARRRGTGHVRLEFATGLARAQGERFRVSCPRSSLAFGRRCIPPGCVAPPRRISLIRLRRRALPGGRSVVLGATTNFWDRTLASAPLLSPNPGARATPDSALTN